MAALRLLESGGRRVAFCQTLKKYVVLFRFDTEIDFVFESYILAISRE